MTVARAFFVRDFRAAWSYRFSFIVQSGGILFSLVSLKFIADLTSSSTPAALASYGGDYFGFALVGAVLSLLSYPVVKSFAGGVRSAQVTGTFEAMLATRANAAAVVVGAGIFPIMSACTQATLVVLVGAVALGARIHAGNAALVLVVLSLTIAALAGIGLFSAAFAIAFKQNEPFSGALLGASFLVSGILYPTSVLPGWLRHLAPLIPTTHAVELCRGLLLDGAATGALAPHFAALGAFAVMLPAGIVAVSLALRYARQSGSLSQY